MEVQALSSRYARSFLINLLYGNINKVLDPTSEVCVIEGQADKLNSKDGSGKLKYIWNNSKHTENLENNSYGVLTIKSSLF